jgi:hypothetical protein
MERQPRDPRIAHLIVDDAIPIPGIEWDGAPDPLPLDHDAWFAWYARQLVRRALVADECARSREARAAHDALCAVPGGFGQIYWLCTFGFIHEPRSDEAKLPFVVEPAQAESILLDHAVLATPKSARSSIVKEKSRQVGATWLSAGFHAWNWKYNPNWNSLVASRTEEMVDKKGDPSSFFWKIDFLLLNIPGWMLPRGFRFSAPHRVSLHIVNPENGNTVRGTATVEDIGRAGRYKWVTFDEANFNPYFEAGWNSAASSTDHREAISSASGKLHKAFYNMVRGIGPYQHAQPTVFVFHWWMRPGRDQAWLAAERETMSEEFFQAEVLMNYRVGGGAYVYPVFERKGTQPLQPRPMLPKYISIDDGYTDACALSGYQVDPVTGDIDVLWAYQNFGKTIDFYGYLLTGQMNSRFEWTDYDRRFIEWLHRHHLTEATYYGDKHGEDTNMVTGTSPFAELTEKFGIYVITNLDPGRNTYVYRQRKLAEYASRMRFNDDWGAPELLAAIQNTRFPERKDTSQSTVESRKPIHDSGSHLRTSAEYFIGNWSFHAFEPEQEGAMMLPPNPMDRLAEQYGNAYKRRKSEDILYEEAVPKWMR